MACLRGLRGLPSAGLGRGGDHPLPGPGPTGDRACGALQGTATAPPPAPAYTAPANPGDGQPVPSNGNTYNLNGVVTGPQQG